MPPLLQYGPEDVVAGQHFNVQPNGQSAIWVRSQGASRSTKVVLNNFELDSLVAEQGSLVTAFVPNWLYEYPGNYELFLRDTKLGQESKHKPFRVSADPQREPLSLEQQVQNLRSLNLELHALLERENRGPRPSFDGWRMRTYHALPWKDDPTWESFCERAQYLKQHFEFGLKETIDIDASNVDTLLWRHWNIAFASRYALELTKNYAGERNFVECGVGDGMSTFFCMSEIERHLSKYGKASCRMHLYDSWQNMRGDSSLEEQEACPKYKDNSLERAQRNLHMFSGNLIFHPGYIPDSLTARPCFSGPVALLHIDLNSAAPTLAALEYFWPMMLPQGVLLFDDYGWRSFESTKKVVDDFLRDKPALLMKLATGQALCFLY